MAVHPEVVGDRRSRSALGPRAQRCRAHAAPLVRVRALEIFLPLRTGTVRAPSTTRRPREKPPSSERGDHGSSGLARREAAGGDFAARLGELGFHLFGQIELVFQKVINPRANLFDFGARQSRNRRFNFLDCAHGGKIPNGLPFAKSGFLCSAPGRILTLLQTEIEWGRLPGRSE